MNRKERTAVENWQWKKRKSRSKPSFLPKSMSSSQKTASDFAKPPKACEKAQVRSCCERVKVGAVVTGMAGVKTSKTT